MEETQIAWRDIPKGNLITGAATAILFLAIIFGFYYTGWKPGEFAIFSVAFFGWLFFTVFLWIKVAK
jgi:hypothetical protein